MPGNFLEVQNFAFFERQQLTWKLKLVVVVSWHWKTNNYYNPQTFLRALSSQIAKMYTCKNFTLYGSSFIMISLCLLCKPNHAYSGNGLVIANKLPYVLSCMGGWRQMQPLYYSKINNANPLPLLYDLACSHSCRMGVLHSCGQPGKVTLTVLESCSPQEPWWTWLTKWVSDTKLMCL